ncbi:FtsX-like permease family protein [Miniimonas sp. S16]|uniref:FtsX-like permease family protein n=1 Tax=Miniimonas sp. S16 TaxID=2171623 RepID=UPI000D525F85|nr:ABC transporter permease [Miniimonas sp. S16]
MWRLTWAQMRRTGGRLVAVGIAIALGTGFITAAFLGSSTLEATALATARAGVGDPDLVVQTSMTTDEVADLAAIDGVAAVQPIGFVGREVGTGQGSEYLLLAPPATDDRLAPAALASGEAPDAPGEIAVPGTTAQRLGVQVGDTVQVVSQTWTADSDEPTREVSDAVVVGITADGSGLGFGLPLGLADATDVAAWQASDGSTWSGATLVLADGADAGAVRDAVAGSVDPDATLQTGEEYAREVASSFTDGVDVFRSLVLAFAGVAMAVAGIVIANTFTVLVAQRTRTLALLRCVGATASQVRASVRLEALVLGVVASIAGVIGGVALGQVVLTILGRANAGVPLPAVVPVSVAAVVVPIVAGVLVTLLAAGGAARLATRVAPLAALRPVDLASGARRRSVRPAIGWTLVGLGLAGMAGALVVSAGGSFDLGLALGVLGGIVSVVGVVVAAITYVPGLTRVLGRTAAAIAPDRSRVSARLAAINAARNPARTTSTATALLVGVALVVMMSTGAAMARSALDTELSEQFAVDVTVSGTALRQATIDAVRAVDGVASSVVMDGASAEVTTDDGTSTVTAYSASDIAALADVVATLPAWGRGVSMADGWVLAKDGPLTVNGLTTSGKLVEGLPSSTVLLDAETFAYASLTPDSRTVWLALTPGADPRAVANAVTDAVSDTTTGTAGATPVVAGGAVERAGYGQIVDTMLLVVVGLLAVAVIIALIGVANTLSLSVVERRRENALLRALGLTRRQLRATLAVEGVLLAGVGALVGIVLGVGYGWLGSMLLLGPTVGLGVGDLAVPWSTVLVIVAVAVVAGVLASVLPARGATRTSPVAALATE